MGDLADHPTGAPPLGSAHVDEFFEANHPGYTGGTGISVNASNVSISGFTISHFATGLALNTSTGVSITGNTFIDNVTGLSKGTAQQVTDVTISDNTFTHGIHGMTINAADGGAGSFDGLTMNDNHFSHMSEKGMYFEQLSNATLPGNRFRRRRTLDGRVAPPFGPASCRTVNSARRSTST